MLKVRIKPGTGFDFDPPQTVTKLPRVRLGGFAPDADGRKLFLAIPEQTAADSVTLVTSALAAKHD